MTRPRRVAAKEVAPGLVETPCQGPFCIRSLVREPPLFQPFAFYTREANGVLLSDWTADFLEPGVRDAQDDIWNDIVEDYIPVPIP